MRHFQTVLLLSLTALACGSATGGHSPDQTAIVEGPDVGGLDPSRDLHNVSSGGAAGSEDVGTGGTDSGGSAGAGGIVGVGGEAGASGGAAGDGGSAGASQGGAAGVAGDGGTAGQAQGGAGGTAGTGGAGGTGGTGGAGGSTSDPPPPACTFDLEHGGPGTRCNELLFETCTLVGGVAQYSSSQCGVSDDVGLNCDSETGCYGECLNGDVRCTGETAEACVDGSWQTTQECGFQCVNGACEGACTPGDTHCDGSSVVTCGSDFHFGSPVVCEGDVNATATCSGAGVCGTACTPGFDDCTAAPGCESNLSSVDSCGGCGIVCPGAPNATRTCNGGVCGLTPNACSPGTANCTGDFVCETNVATDEANCGGCGVKCFGTCTAGVCDVETVADLANSANDNVVDLVLDGVYVYWWTYNAGTNTILRAPKTGGAPETITTFSELTIGPRDNALLVDNGQVYWATPTGVFRKPVAGGAVQTLSTQGAAGLAIDGGKLYWNNANTTNVPSCYDQFYSNGPSFLNCNGSAVVTFYAVNLSTLAQTYWQTTQYEFSHVLGVQGSDLFVARFEGYFGGIHAEYNTAILVLDAATGAYSRTITNMARIDGFGWGLGVTFGQAVFTGTSVVFTTERGIYQTSTTSFGEASQIKAYGTFVSPEFIAADASDVYFSNPGFSVSRISRSTLAVEDIFGSPGNTTARIAVDADYAYWTVGGTSGAVLRAAK